MKKILLVEDEENFGSLMKNYLELSGYEVDWKNNGSEGYSTFMKGKYDLCILDVMMPHMDGFTLAKKIKSKSPNTPIFFLTAKNAKDDVVEGYKIGADDYLTKPFDTDVLILKIKAIFSRLENQENNLDSKELYEFGNFTFKPGNRILKHVDKGDVKLSPKESGLLELLCQYENKIMPREIALVKIWKEDNYFTKRSMDVYITKLRKHLISDSKISIDTFHQMGFQLTIEK